MIFELKKFFMFLSKTLSIFQKRTLLHRKAVRFGIQGFDLIRAFLLCFSPNKSRFCQEYRFSDKSHQFSINNSKTFRIIPCYSIPIKKRATFDLSPSFSIFWHLVLHSNATGNKVFLIKLFD